MDIDRFAEVVELSKTLNFSEAAKNLYISQPTLSKHIVSLEKELNVALFKRSGMRVSLSQAGLAVLPIAFKMVELRKELDAQLNAIKSMSDVQKVVGGLVDEPEVLALIGSILSFMGPKYGYDFLVLSKDKYSGKGDLDKEGLFDIVFDYFDEDDDLGGEYSVTPFLRVPLVAVVDSSHRMASWESADIRDFAHERLIRLEGSYIARAWRFIEGACNQAGFEPVIRREYFMEISDLLRITSAMDDSVLILSCVAARRMQFNIAPNCKVVPISASDAYMPLSAVIHKDRMDSVMVEILEFIKERYKSSS